MCFQTKQKTNQQSTQTTQNNLWDDPNLQQFLQGYNQQYSGPNISQVSAPANSWMTGAADAQAGVAGNLTPAFGTASALAGTGIDPGSIQQWMNPFENNVIQNLQNDFASENARELANIRGRAARTGALGNSTNAVAERLATDSARDRLDSQITNARLAGWQQASGMNLQDAQTQLAASGQLGALTNAATGANMGTGSLGQNIWQTNLASTMLPYQLYNQGIQGYQGLGGLAGSTSSGTSTGTQTTSPSIGSVIAGGLGTIMSGMPSGWFNPGGWFGGGSKMARDGGAIIKREHGGPVMTPFHGSGSSFADKVRDAHKAVTEMRKGGGRVEKEEPRHAFAGGGAPYTGFAPRLFDPYLSERRADALSAVAPPMTPSSIFVPSSGIDYSGSGLITRFTGRQPTALGTPYRSDASEFTEGYYPDASEYTGFPVSTEPAPFRPFGEGPAMGEFERPGTVDITSQYTADPSLEGAEQPATVTRGGAPGPAVPDFVTTASAAAAKPAYTRDPGEAEIGPSRAVARGPEGGGGWFSGGIWSGERETNPLRNLGLAMTQIGGGPFAGFGANVLQQQQLANQDRQARLAADRLQHEMAHQRAVLTETSRHNRAAEDAGNWTLRPDGTMVNKRTGEIRGSAVPSEFERRRAEAAAAGMSESDPGYTQFILTGRMGSTELNATQTNLLHKSREEMVSAQDTAADLQRALVLNRTAYEGPGAGRTTTFMNSVWPTQVSNDTAELSRLMTGQVLGNLKRIFGGNPTEGERAILSEVEGSINLPRQQREAILKRAQSAVQRRQQLLRDTISGIENRTFTRPGGVTAPPPTETTAPPERPAAVPAGSQWSASRRQWRTSDGKLFDAEGNPVNG
jgi:hypothetical protein